MWVLGSIGSVSGSWILLALIALFNLLCINIKFLRTLVAMALFSLPVANAYVLKALALVGSRNCLLFNSPSHCRGLRFRIYGRTEVIQTVEV